jgi:hypothetical protein
LSLTIAKSREFSIKESVFELNYFEKSNRVIGFRKEKIGTTANHHYLNAFIATFEI